jgi:DNA-binding response OmpR family regulator
MKRVLVVDDDTNTLEFLNIALTQEGYYPVCARTSIDAFKEVQKEAPDIVITDVKMPIMDGIELCAVIRAMHNIPIVIMTGAENVPRHREIWDFHLTKPVDVPDLVATINRLLKEGASKRLKEDADWLLGDDLDPKSAT